MICKRSGWEILNFINNNIFALVTAITAIIALYQTELQIKINNKQHLFDRRMRNYSIILELVRLYEENEPLLKELHIPDEPIDVKLLFYGLINNSYLEGQHSVIEHPLEQPYHKDFLTKLEEIMVVANEINFIYSDFDEIRQFVINYKEVLHSIYKYQIMQNKTTKQAQQLKKTYIQMQNIIREPAHREKLLTSYENLINSYEIMKKRKSIKRMKKEIKL